MAEIKVNLEDSVKAKESLRGAPPSSPSPMPQEEQVGDMEKATPFRSRRPSDWTIVSLGEGKIDAKCSNGESFQGTVAEFNRRIRGG